jgi:hypothetical protein
VESEAFETIRRCEQEVPVEEHGRAQAAGVPVRPLKIHALCEARRVLSCLFICLPPT